MLRKGVAVSWLGRQKGRLPSGSRPGLNTQKIADSNEVPKQDNYFGNVTYSKKYANAFDKDRVSSAVRQYLDHH